MSMAEQSTTDIADLPVLPRPGQHAVAVGQPCNQTKRWEAEWSHGSSSRQRELLERGHADLGAPDRRLTLVPDLSLVGAALVE